MIGINEFFADNSERPGINPKYVADNIFKIADIINDYSPKTKIFIHTILPINNDQYIEVKKVNYNFLQKNFIPSINKQVEETNSILTDGNETTISGSGGLQIDASNVFPRGITIYGRYIEIDITSGALIAYIGD